MRGLAWCALGLLGCDPSADLAAAPAPKPVARVQAPSLIVRAEGDTHMFTRGTATWSEGGLQILLTDPARRCGDELVPTRSLNFEITRGPGDQFMTGRDINVWVQIGRPGSSYYAGFDPHNAVARIEPFGLRKGAIIRGSLDVRRRVLQPPPYGSKAKPTELLYEGAGTFEVTICADPPPSKALPEDKVALAGTLGGTWNGKKLALSAGVATISRDVDDNDHVYLNDIQFASGQPYDCASAKKEVPALQLSLNNMGGASKTRLLGGAQMVHVGISEGRGVNSYLFNQDGYRSWITFERLAWTAGGEIQGTLYASSAAGAAEAFRIMGKFTARVCDTP